MCVFLPELRNIPQARSRAEDFGPRVSVLSGVYFHADHVILCLVIMFLARGAGWVWLSFFSRGFLDLTFGRCSKVVSTASCRANSTTSASLHVCESWLGAR